VKGKASLTPLTELRLTETQRSALKGVSITTVEELAGIGRADPRGTCSLLGIDEAELGRIMAKALSVMKPEVRELFGRPTREYPLGALPPDE
jgi:hypothetical protein